MIDVQGPSWSLRTSSGNCHRDALSLRRSVGQRDNCHRWTLRPRTAIARCFDPAPFLQPAGITGCRHPVVVIIYDDRRKGLTIAYRVKDIGISWGATTRNKH